MTVRLFVTSAAVLIFTWLAATYFRAVPMDTYPHAPVATQAPVEENTLATASTTSADQPAGAVASESTSR